MKPLARLLLLLICFSTQILFGQNGSITELQNQLNTAKGQQRVEILNELSSKLINTQPKQAESYADEAYKLSKDINYRQGLFQSTLFLANYEKEAKHYNKAARMALRSIDAAQELKSRKLELQGLELLKTIYALDKRKKKLAETELAYKKIKNELDLDQRSIQLAELKKEYESTEEKLELSESKTQEVIKQKNKIQRTLNLTVEEKLRKEKELAVLGQEKAELELRTLQLENETVRNELEISEKEKEILQYDARLKQQQFWQSILLIGLVTAILVSVLLIRNYQLKKNQAEEKATMQQQMLVQEKMAALGQITAGIAHEIKNPLNFVNNFAEGSSILVEELMETISDNKTVLTTDQYSLIVELVDEFKQNSADILHHGKRADRIVNTMMEHSRESSGEMQLTDINRLIEDHVNVAYHGYKALEPDFILNIFKKLDHNITPIYVVPQNLSRVLLNIFNNAFYAVHQKRIALGEAFQPELSIKTEVEDNWVHIEIRDNGTGIPQDIRKNIFMPFFTTKPTGTGNTGLGLSISYDIVVQEHQGRLEVESEPGDFTAFSVILPAKETKEEVFSLPSS